MAVYAGVGLNGGRGRDRTCDQSIKSRMLYQLSYASACVAVHWAGGDFAIRPDVRGRARAITSRRIAQPAGERFRRVRRVYRHRLCGFDHFAEHLRKANTEIPVRASACLE